MISGFLTPRTRDRLWNDPDLQTYYGEEMLDNQAPWLVPDDWQAQYEKWMSEDFRRSIFEMHADFLESLFDKEGYTTLYRAMDSKGFTRRGYQVPEPGAVVDIGQHWTYSGNADLSSAQIELGFGEEGFDIVFKGLVHISQVDWRNTLTDHLYRHWGEKQIFVKGPVEILDVFPIGQLRKRAPTINFDQWLKKHVS